jgi:hypothetical protein
LAAALVAAGGFAPGDSGSATLTVTTTAQTSASLCALRAAIDSINLQTDQGACVASGAYGASDSVVFDPSVTGNIAFSTGDPLFSFPAGPSALFVLQPMQIVGPGSTMLTLKCVNPGFRMLEIAGVSNPVAIQGLVIANCAPFMTTTLTGTGAGVLVDGSASNVIPSVHFTDVALTLNTGSSGGGLGIVPGTLGADVTLDVSAVTRNRAGRGGGIAVVNTNPANAPPNSAATLTVTDSLVQNNTTPSNGFGGGIAAIGNASGVLLTRATVDANQAALYGGGIAVQTGGSVSVLDSTVSNNSASPAAGFGGGGVAVFDQGTVSTVSATNSTLSGNKTGGSGGAVFAFRTHAGAIVLANTTIANNLAQFGGGVAALNAIPSALLTPAVVQAPAQTIDIANTIVAGNSAANNGNDVWSSPPDTWGASYSVIGATSPTVTLTGVGNATDGAVPPPFGAGGWLSPLQNNGGPTQTHALLTGVSDPALNAGDPAFSGLADDQRGPPHLRIEGGRLDVGAFEAMALVTLPVPGPGRGALAALGALIVALGWRRSRRRRD